MHEIWLRRLKRTCVFIFFTIIPYFFRQITIAAHLRKQGSKTIRLFLTGFQYPVARFKGWVRVNKFFFHFLNFLPYYG